MQHMQQMGLTYRTYLEFTFPLNLCAAVIFSLYCYRISATYRITGYK